MLRPILIAGFRDENHSKYGGYDKVFDYPGSCNLTDKSVPFGTIPVGKRGKGINCFLLDLKTRWKRYFFPLTHIIYGDAQIFFPYLKSKTHKVVATIHMNPDERKRMPSLYYRALQNLDGVIVLSRGQVIQLEKYGVKATFIPHGFTPPVYTFQIPNDIQKRRLSEDCINVVFCGTNYRDYNVLFQSLDYLKDVDSVVFHVVGQKKDIYGRLKEYKNVRIYPRLIDDEYYTLISCCDYNFLPLTYATANNALLEAQFLGVRSILPEIDGISDYAAPFPFNFFYSDTEVLFDFWRHLKKNAPCPDLITFSHQFAWEEIYKRLGEYYQQFL